VRSLCLLLLLACGRDPSTKNVGPATVDTADAPVGGEDGDTGPGSEGDGRIEFPPPERGYQLHMGPFEIPAFTEVYQCKIIQTPNTEPADIIGLSHLASESVHHFNAWALLDDPGREMEGPCSDLWAETNMALANPLYASQTSSFEGWFPDGVAGQLPAEQWVLMEYHAINPTAQDQITEGYINAMTAAPDTIEHYANGLYGSNTDLEIPPGQTASFTKKCLVDVQMNVFVMGSHFHQLGTFFEVYRLDAAGQRVELVYENDDWESPELEFWTETPLVLLPGEGFEYTCHFENTTDQTVGFGPSASDEMCTLAALYYPDAGFKLCMDPAR